MTRLALILTLAASPAFAAPGPFFSLHNTNFVVLIAFLLFIGVLLKFKVPGLLGGLLDKRAAGIRADLDEARKLREEAQTVLASYERKHREVKEQADRIVETAKREAQEAAEAVKAEIKASIKRRLQAAEEQIASAEAAALRSVRDQAIAVAVAAAGEVLAAQLGATEKAALVTKAIAEVDAKLH